MKEINLLPKNRQQEMRLDATYHNWQVLIWLSLASFLLVLLIQFAAGLYLQSQLTQITDQIAGIKKQVNKEENAQLKKKIQTVNDLVTDYQTLAASAPRWSKFLKAFANIPPAGVKVTSFSVDSTRKSVTVTGMAPTRELAIQFYNNVLADSQHFYNIDYPLENVSKPTNVSFHYTFFIKDDLLQ